MVPAGADRSVPPRREHGVLQHDRHRAHHLQAVAAAAATDLLPGVLDDADDGDAHRADGAQHYSGVRDHLPVGAGVRLGGGDILQRHRGTRRVPHLQVLSQVAFRLTHHCKLPTGDAECVRRQPCRADLLRALHLPGHDPPHERPPGGHLQQLQGGAPRVGPAVLPQPQPGPPGRLRPPQEQRRRRHHGRVVRLLLSLERWG
mmetsp:Transcript_3900/g.8911  ORF Transcript_3900/g.8911 Transcript_3900/m.8911 type:complete len:202 (-) Transcript_3900:5-610(-)